MFSYRSDVETNKFQGWIPESLEEVNRFIEKNPTAFNTSETWFQLVVIQNKTNTIIGDIGIHFIDGQQCELGCTLSSACIL